VVVVVVSEFHSIAVIPTCNGSRRHEGMPGKRAGTMRGKHPNPNPVREQVPCEANILTLTR
jgi:hypothetical protein